MKTKFRKIIIVLSLLLVAVIIYIFSTFNDVFARRDAYIYDPNSDDIYLLELGPVLDPKNKIGIFKPFNDAIYREPKGGRYIGKLTEIVEEDRLNLDRLLEYARALDQGIEVENPFPRKDFNLNIPRQVEFWDFHFTSLDEMPQGKALPPYFKDVLAGKNLPASNILKVDVVVIYRQYSLVKSGEGQRVSVNTIKGAVLFKGLAAYFISSANVLPKEEP